MAALQHPTRSRIISIIWELPALNIRELSDLLGIQRTAANHHVRRLIKEGLVVTYRQGPQVLHFPAAMAPSQRVVLSVLRIPSVRGVVEEMYRDPHQSAQALAARLRLTTRTVGRAKRILRHHGLIRVENAHDPRARAVHLHPDLRVALAHLQPVAGSGPGSPP